MPASGPRHAYLMVASPLEHPRPAAGPSRRPRPTGRCRHSAHGTPAARCRRRFAHRSGHSRSTAPAVLLMVASPLEHPRPAAGPSRRPRPTGRCRHSAHGTPAARCRRRFAHRSGHSRSTAPAVLLMVAAPLEYPRPAAGPSRRPRPTGRCRHSAHGTPAARCRRRFAHRSGHSRSTAPAVPPALVWAPVMALYHCRSS
jgi:hypothetical protein